MGSALSTTSKMVKSQSPPQEAPPVEKADSSAPTCNGAKKSVLSILHFNDVYNVEEQKTEPLGGAARFKTAFKSFADRDPLILFSGDILAPSIMSSFTHGEQMIPVMNQLNVHCSVYGNHDFDFGLERLIEVAEQTNCPWLMSNVDDKETNRPLAEGEIYKILNWKGWTIGLIGLVEEEWLDTLATIDTEQVTFMDFVDRGRELAVQLKNEGCDYVIALTHMRTPNDIRLAENVDEIDLILGGHDHVYEKILINGKYILKSGTDFREFSVITLTDQKSGVDVDIERVEVTSRFPPDEELKEALSGFEETVSAKMEETLGNFGVELDGQFSSIRTSETNLGNFICDILLAACNGDVTLLNSGTLRSDRIHPPGKFTMRDLATVLPMLDALCVIGVTGKQIIEALENGVSQYPKLEGRFPQVAGISFAFNPQAPPGSRVYHDIIKIGDEYLNEESTYRLVTKEYMRQGRDGYTMLANCPILVDEEMCPMMSTAVQNHFQAIQARQGKTRRNSVHRQSLLLLSRRHSLIRGEDIPTHAMNPAPHGTHNRHSAHSFSNTPTTSTYARSVSVDSVSKSGVAHRRLSRQDSYQELEDWACKLAPKIEGRIVIANDEEAEKLKQEKVLEHQVSVIEELEEPATPTLKEDV